MRLIFISLFIITLTSCGIENFDSVTELNPPLALNATSSNREIQLTFSAYNNEPAFGGYNIYVGLSEYEIQQKKNILKNAAGEIPFIQDTPFNSVRTIALTVSENTQGNAFALSDNFYIGITAYNVQTGVDSKPSNIVNITIQD